MTDDRNRRARRLAESASTDTVTEDLLLGGNEYTGEFVLYGEPPIAHLEPDEQPHAVLFNELKGVGLGTKRNTITPEGAAKSVFIVTDHRVLLLVGQQDGDWIRSIPLEAVTGAAYHTGLMKHRVVVDTTDTTYHLWVDASYEEPALDATVEILESAATRVADAADPEPTRNAVSDGTGQDRNTSADRSAGESDPAVDADTADRTADGSQDDPLEMLERLKDLHEAGVLTDEEFQAKKSELLDQI